MDILHDLTIKQQQSVPRFTYITTYLSTYICIYIFGSTSTSTQVHTSAKGENKRGPSRLARLSVCLPARPPASASPSPASKPASQSASQCRTVAFFSRRKEKQQKKRDPIWPAFCNHTQLHSHHCTCSRNPLFFLFSFLHTYTYTHTYIQYTTPYDGRCLKARTRLCLLNPRLKMYFTLSLSPPPLYTPFLCFYLPMYS